MDGVGIRNLEQIQEREPGRGGSHLSTLIVASIAGACIVFAGFALLKRPQTSQQGRHDPLAELAKNNVASPSSAQVSLDGNDVAFPNLLSDDPNPTTALAAIRRAGSPAGSGMPFALPPGSPTEPPPAGDKLPVVPLPAQNFLALSPVVTNPRDSLTAMANQASTPNGEEATVGGPGFYQLQVSSFRKEKQAEKFATALRQRGHRAYWEAALVPGKGTWYRVRIGPFKKKHDAVVYRKDFEDREHIVTFLIDPPDVKVAKSPLAEH